MLIEVAHPVKRAAKILAFKGFRMGVFSGLMGPRGRGIVPLILEQAGFFLRISENSGRGLPSWLPALKDGWKFVAKVTASSLSS
jgi:hypothetical protein